LGKPAFQEFANRILIKGSWNFTVLERIFIFDKEMVWFDELLNTQMKICQFRSTGENMKNGKSNTMFYR
jgi:hypothetical protein